MKGKRAMEPVMSNDRWVWSDASADVELVELPMRVSISKNRLVFGCVEEKPAPEHSFSIVNHSEHPVAFKILTSDNYSYFVSQKIGVIEGVRVRALPFVKTNNTQQITVFRRPTSCYRQDFGDVKRTKLPHKQRMHILVAPLLSWTSNPASAFLFTRSFEKLRICLEFTAKPPSPNDEAQLLQEKRGWNTWGYTTQKKG
uniref:MSP domain-containing protein n=1 Tax=Steinernema glaseri TaxID=37863 RepID=A0A1I7YPR6_9BILA